MSVREQIREKIVASWVCPVRLIDGLVPCHGCQEHIDHATDAIYSLHNAAVAEVVKAELGWALTEAKKQHDEKWAEERYVGLLQERLGQLTAPEVK